MFVKQLINTFIEFYQQQKQIQINCSLTKQFKTTHELTIGVEFASRVIEVELETNVKL